MTFEPRDPDFRNRCEVTFARQDAMINLGISMREFEAGHATLEMPFNKGFVQHHGFMHAGIITTAMDSACGFAAFTLMAPEAEVLTVEFKCNFLSPAKGEYFLFRAAVLKPGRTLSVAEAKTYAVTGGQERLVASMTATLMAVTVGV